MFDIENVIRYLAAYVRDTDSEGGFPVAFEYEFSIPVPLRFLQKIFRIDPSDPDQSKRYLIDCYAIDEKTAKLLQPFFKEKLDTKKYDLFLECVDKKSHLDWKYATHEDLVRYIIARSRENETEQYMPGIRYDLKKPISLLFLQNLFNREPNSKDLVTCEWLDKKSVEALQPYFSEKLDLEKYYLTLCSQLKPEYLASRHGKEK